MGNCIWGLSQRKRHCEFCSYGGGCDRNEAKATEKNLEDRLTDYCEKMNAIIDGDIRDHSRISKLVWGRYIVAYQLRKDGYSLSKIGEMLNMHHSSVMHAVFSVNSMLCTPFAYPYELEIWEEFQKSLNLQHENNGEN